jgi:hypothetical protein
VALKQPLQTADIRCVAASDRRHLDDLSFDQLNPIVLMENACLPHEVELVDRESAARRFDCHLSHILGHANHAIRFRASHHACNRTNIALLRPTILQ